MICDILLLWTYADSRPGRVLMGSGLGFAAPE